MKRAIVFLALALVACRKDKGKNVPPVPVAASSASVAVENLIPFETPLGVRIDVPEGFGVEQFKDDDIIVRTPERAKLQLTAMGSCGRSLKRVCSEGKVVGDTCEENGSLTRISDGVVHTLSFEGKVSPSVLRSWKVPASTPVGVGFYCSPREIVENMAAEQ